MGTTRTARDWDVRNLLQVTAKFFAARGVDAPRLAADWLLAHVLGCRRVELYLDVDRRLNATALDAYRDLVRRHAAGEPLQYLVGEAEFYGLPFHVEASVLIPRPDTEILVEALLRRMQALPAGEPVRVLELGAGSGAVAVCLAVKHPSAEVWSTEVSPAAARVARRNAARHEVADRVHVLVMDRFAALAPDLHGMFGVLVANPPYVRRRAWDHLPASVREHEPRAALDGGDDGLDYYRYLCGPGLQFLAPGGTLAVEIGADQGEEVAALFAAAGLRDLERLRDYGSRDRVVLGVRAEGA